MPGLQHIALHQHHDGAGDGSAQVNFNFLAIPDSFLSSGQYADLGVQHGNQAGGPRRPETHSPTHIA